MNPTTLAFLVGVLLGVSAGMMLAAPLAAAHLKAACQHAHTEGLTKGIELGRRDAIHSVMASDIAAANFGREEVA